MTFNDVKITNSYEEGLCYLNTHCKEEKTKANLSYFCKFMSNIHPDKLKDVSCQSIFQYYFCVHLR